MADMQYNADITLCFLLKLVKYNNLINNKSKIAQLETFANKNVKCLCLRS